MSCALVLTTIADPHSTLRQLRDLAVAHQWRFYIAGDAKSPADFSLPGARYFDLDAQRSSGLRLASQCPLNSYTRKNIGYLLAIRDGCDVLVETDDDNAPTDLFGEERMRNVDAFRVSRCGWTNVYTYFSGAFVWPRGFPLELVRSRAPELPNEISHQVDCPIQQGLADGNPDVDAIYRLLLPLPVKFEARQPVALGEGAWCPFNSQNTTWFSEAFPLLYLPSYCSFRSTDIWRGFVAQRIAWEYGWSILFHRATVVQSRNEHNLLKDFEDEISGYLNNGRIGQVLESLTLSANRYSMTDNLFQCYEALVSSGFIDARELGLLRLWIEDLTQNTRPRAMAAACP